MSMSALSKQKATTLTRAAQGALALLLVGAGTAIAMSARFAQEPERAGPLVLPTVDLGGSKDKQVAVSNDIDFAAVGDRLGAVSNHPKPVVAAAPTGGGTTAPPAPTNEMKYLGAVGVGPSKVALISDNGKQRFVGLNDDLAGGKVELITDTEVRVGGGASKVLALASRSHDVITRAGAPRPPMPAANGNRTPMPGTLQTYQPAVTPAEPVDEHLRAKANVPEYVAPGEERDFISLREELRATTKYESEEQLNEYASKMWEEKKGSTPEMQKYRKEQESNRQMQKEKPQQ